MMRQFAGLLTFFYSFMASGLFAEAVDNAAPPRDQGLWQTLSMVGIALLFFYFILWRPEQKRRKEMDQKRDSVKKGDRVTAMGMIGTVAKVQEHTIIVKMVDGNKIEFVKGAISEVLPGTEQEAGKTEKEKEDS